MTTPNPMPVIPLEYEHPPEGAAARTSRALRIFTFGTWGACLIAWILIVWVDVESVIVTGPIIAILGGAVGVRGLFERRHALAVLGAVHLGVCLLFVMLVNLLHWSPSDAQIPFTILGALHVTGSGFATAWLLLMRGSYRRMVARI